MKTFAQRICPICWKRFVPTKVKQKTCSTKCGRMMSSNFIFFANRPKMANEAGK